MSASPGHAAKIMSKDLAVAGIPEQTASGKLDFHALRTAFVNLVFEYGKVSPKEAQDLARHSTPDLTFNVYGRSRENRLVEGIERLAEAVMPIERVPEEYRLAAGAEQENATLSLTTDYASFESDLSGESFPAAPLPVTRTDPTQNPNKFTAKPLQHRSVGASQQE